MLIRDVQVLSCSDVILNLKINKLELWDFLRIENIETARQICENVKVAGCKDL